MLVTAYEKPSVDVISLADDQIIKQIYTKTQPDEIVIDNAKNCLHFKLRRFKYLYGKPWNNDPFKANQNCRNVWEIDFVRRWHETLLLRQKTRDIWAIELDNNYLLKEIGKFPNVSKIAFTNNKVYVTSRTKNRIAIIDYETVGLIVEMEICEKPVDMLTFHNRIYVLGAGDNSIQVIDAKPMQLQNPFIWTQMDFRQK